MVGDPPVNESNKLQNELEVPGHEEADVVNLVSIMAANFLFQTGIETGEDECVEAHEDERVKAHEDEHGLYYQILPMKLGCGGCRTHLANQLDLVGDVGEDMIESRRMLLFRPNPNYMNVKIGEEEYPNHITRRVYGEMVVLNVVKIYYLQCSKQVGYKIMQLVEPQNPPPIFLGECILIKGQDRNVPSHMMQV